MLTYCPRCQKKINGKFCSECGAKGTEQHQVNNLNGTNWRAEKDLRQLITNQKVQEFIKKFLDESRQSISAEEFLEKIDKLFLPGTGVSLKKLMEVTVPIYRNLGIQTGKSKTDHFDYSIQEVLVKLLCSLAKNNYPLKEVHEAHEGILLVAEIPSSMKTFGGDILITLEEKLPKTSVHIAAKIKGQLYDWGKSKAVIKALFLDIEGITLDLD